jgi:hypothetical protein
VVAVRRVGGKADWQRRSSTGCGITGANRKPRCRRDDESEGREERSGTMRLWNTVFGKLRPGRAQEREPAAALHWRALYRSARFWHGFFRGAAGRVPPGLAPARRAGRLLLQPVDARQNVPGDAAGETQDRPGFS